MKKITCFILILATQLFGAEPTTPPQEAPAPAEIRRLQFALTAGLNALATNNALLKKNEGAEIGVITTLPVKIWRENANLVTLRGQFTNYSNGIELNSTNAAGEKNKLVNAGHSQLRMDFRQVFTLWNVSWSAGLGFQIPLSTRVMSPRGEFSFADARGYYPEAGAGLSSMDRSYAFYLRLGIDQKLFDDNLLLGLGFEINLAEAPRTDQRAFLNLYAGARLW
jgi:hypothetical protein